MTESIVGVAPQSSSQKALLTSLTDDPKNSKGKRVRHKPDSVQWRVIYLGLLLPKVSCGTPKTGQEKDQPLPLRPCSQPGFTELVPHDTTGALLPTPLHPYLNIT